MAQRFVVLGAGAIGGVVGARLVQHGHDVVLVARGPHHDAIRDRGLTLETPDGRDTLEIPVVDHPARMTFRPDDIVLLTVKGQHTASALGDLAAVAPPTTPVACLQNGVENERWALRLFPNVYGVCVMCPTSHLEPGLVQAWSAPLTGRLDVGRHPDGVDDTARSIAAAFSSSTFQSEALPDIMREKYGKLLDNLGNAIEAAFGTAVRRSELGDRVRAEGESVLRAAGVDFPGRGEDRRTGVVQPGLIDGRSRGGGSSWQSLARGTGTIEVDHLNGEIVLLGRLHGVPTPLNEGLQRLVRAMSADAAPPASADLDGFLRDVAATTG